MKNNIFRFCLIFVLGIVYADVCHAVVLSRIDVSGNERMDKESIRILSDVKVGDNINSETVNDIAIKLQTSGYFSSVDTSLTGSVLKIKVSESAIINMVTVEGNDEIDTDDLKKEIKTKERASYDKSVIGADVQRMLTLYQRKGFLEQRLIQKRLI